jgi:hypothetical protein
LVAWPKAAPASIKAMLRPILNLKAATSFNGMLLEVRFEAPQNVYYEGAWTESWTHRRCRHHHRTLFEAAECAIPEGPAWYVFAVENGKPRELTPIEETGLEEFRRSRHLLKRARGTV